MFDLGSAGLENVGLVLWSSPPEPNLKPQSILTWRLCHAHISRLQWQSKEGIHTSSHLNLYCVLMASCCITAYRRPNWCSGLKTFSDINIGQGSPNLFLEGQCPAEFSSNPNQTHLNQLIKVRIGLLENSRQVCWGKLELNSAGHQALQEQVWWPLT